MATTQASNKHAASLTEIWNFPKLKGRDDYQPWAKRMKSALKYCGLWVVTSDSNHIPTRPPLDDDVNAVPDRVEAYDEAEILWTSLNNHASGLIYSMCEETPAESIEDEKIAINRWQHLKKKYTDSGFVARHIKLQELWSTSLASSSNSIESYIANIRTRSKDLKRMGAPIDQWILESTGILSTVSLHNSTMFLISIGSLRFFARKTNSKDVTARNRL